MKIAVCGSGLGEDEGISEKAKEIGREIAKSGNILLSGGGTGYPHSAVKGAILENGRVVCYSPAKDREEHISCYGFPLEKNAEYIFTDKGIPGRNIPLVQNADAVVIVGGRIGTLNEFTIAFYCDKKLGVLKNSGGIAGLIPKIMEIVGMGIAGTTDIHNKTDIHNRRDKIRVVYESDAGNLIKRLQ